MALVKLYMSKVVNMEEKTIVRRVTRGARKKRRRVSVRPSTPTHPNTFHFSGVTLNSTVAGFTAGWTSDRSGERGSGQSGRKEKEKES